MLWKFMYQIQKIWAYSNNEIWQTQSVSFDSLLCWKRKRVKQIQIKRIFLRHNKSLKNIFAYKQEKKVSFKHVYIYIHISVTQQYNILYCLRWFYKQAIT